MHQIDQTFVLVSAKRKRVEGMRRRETLLTKWRKEEKRESERKKAKNVKVEEEEEEEEEQEEKKIGNVCDFKPFRRGNRDRSSW